MAAEVADPLVVADRPFPAPDAAGVDDAASVDPDLVDAHRVAAGAARLLGVVQRAVLSSSGSGHPCPIGALAGPFVVGVCRLVCVHTN